MMPYLRHSPLSYFPFLSNHSPLLHRRPKGQGFVAENLIKELAESFYTPNRENRVFNCQLGIIWIELKLEITCLGE